ncbi:MAG: hypothetical protein R3Y28_06430 [Candidatus Gastranaerophilales bacterium]
MVTNIISAIGNNNSIYPLLVRDCGIEVPSKVYLTYKQNEKESKEIAKLASRERFLDEYAVSAVWLGGIPLMDKLSDKFIKSRGYNPDVNLKLFKEEKEQGIDLNLKKFQGKVPEKILEDLKKVKSNKGIYEKLLATKFIASTSVPIMFMGFVLPKLIFASSAKKITEQKKKDAENKKIANDTFFKTETDKFKQKINFTGNIMSNLANFSTVDKMIVTDGGYAGGRVITARNKNERYDVGFKMAGMMFLNFVAPKYIEKGFNKITDTNLGPKMLADKGFLDEVKEQKLNLPKSNEAKDLIDFVDDNPDSYFVKYAQKFNKIKMLDKKTRDPRAYVDIKNLAKFNDDIINFAKKSISSGDFKKYTQKAKFIKSASIISNVAISSALLAYALPKAQFAFRKIITGSDLEPGLAQNDKN